MINSYERGDSPILKYSTDIPFLDNKIDFKEGVNIIVGPNGSGKTTLVVGLAKLMFACQQGYSKFNGLSDFSDLFELTSQEVEYSDMVKGNCNPILFNNRYETGYFDDDNFTESLISIVSQKNSSSGEIQLQEWNSLFGNYKKLVPFEDMISAFKNRANDVYQERVDSWYKWLLSGHVECSNRNNITFLLDEPTSNMDTLNRFEFWKNMFSLDKGLAQIIVSTHDITPFIKFNRDKYNIIETEKGYFNKIMKNIGR